MIEKENLKNEDSGLFNNYRFLKENDLNNNINYRDNKSIEENYFSSKNFTSVYEIKNFTYKKIKNLIDNNYKENLRLVQNNQNFIYSICPVFFHMCPSDISKINSTDNYNSIFKEFFNKFNSTQNLKKNLPEFSNETFILENVYETKDEKKVDISLLNFNFIIKKLDGNITWESTYPEKVACFYKIELNGTYVDSDSIWNCFDYFKCGSFNSNKNKITGSREQRYWKQLYPDRQYWMQIICVNDVPYPKKELRSEIVIKSFTIEQTSFSNRVINSEFHNADPNFYSEESLNIMNSGNILMNYNILFILLLSYLILFIF
jgi:hypothetical protein